MDMKTMEKEIVKLKADSAVDAEYLAEIKADIVLLRKMFKKLAKSYSELADRVDELREDFDLQTEVDIAAFNDIYETLYPEEGKEIDVEDEEEDDGENDEEDDDEDFSDDEDEEDTEEETPAYHKVVVAFKKTSSNKEEKKEEKEEKAEDDLMGTILHSLGDICDILKDKLKKETE